MSTPPPLDEISTRLVPLLERHVRLLALELAAAGEELESLAPDPARAWAWDGFAGLRKSLATALAEPAVEAWIRHVQRLLESPSLRACPEHHVPRAWARFSALCLNLAGLEEGTARGRAVLLGGGSIPVLQGAAQLRPMSARRTVVRWCWDGRLHLWAEDGRLLAEMDEPATDRPADRVPGGTFRVDRAERLDGVHLFHEPRCAAHPGSEAAPGFPTDFARAVEALPPATRRLLALSIHAAGPGCPAHPFSAYTFLALDSPPSPSGVARGLAESLVTRLGRVYRFDTGAILTEAVAFPAAELLDAVTAELLGGATDAPGSMLARLVSACEERQPAARRPAPASEAGRLLDFGPVLVRAGIPPDDPGLWTERKNHRPDRAPGWRMLDALLRLSPHEIARLRAALADWPTPEVRHFGLACVEYHAGRFAEGLAQVLACLEADRAAEEYWLLLAFCARHLRHFDIFDEIVFGGLRSDGVIERLRGTL